MGEAINPDESRYDDSDEREAILQSLYRGLISSKTAAEMLASVSLSTDDIESGLEHTWQMIVYHALQSSDHHRALSELLVEIANLPAAKDDHGQQRTIGDLRIWGTLAKSSAYATQQ